MRKPNAILHMMGYGFVYGLLLAMLFFWGVMLVGLGWPWDQLPTLQVVLPSLVGAFVLSAVPGAMLGFIEGWILWFLTRNMRLPLTEAEITIRHNIASGVIGSLTFLGIYALVTWLFGGYLSLLLM